MKRISAIFFICIGFFLQFTPTYADEVGVYRNKTIFQILSGDFTLDDIPTLIINIIEMLIQLSGTICIVALIYYSVQMQLASGITGDSSGVDHAKKGMKGTFIGFIISMLAWFLIDQFIKIMSGI